MIFNTKKVKFSTFSLSLYVCLKHAKQSHGEQWRLRLKIATFQEDITHCKPLASHLDK